jgi:hypothetical protein
MKHNRLLRPEGPWLHLLAGMEEAARELLQELSRSGRHVVGRVIRGQKSRTTADFFNECAAALQFPSYFGENWDAFEECLTDLEWLSGDAYVLLITNSSHLLDKEPAEQLHLLLQVLNETGQEWNQPVHDSGSRPARPFHFMLQCRKEEEAGLRKKLQAAKVTFDSLP